MLNKFYTLFRLTQLHAHSWNWSGFCDNLRFKCLIINICIFFYYYCFVFFFFLNCVYLFYIFFVIMYSIVLLLKKLFVTFTDMKWIISSNQYATLTLIENFYKIDSFLRCNLNIILLFELNRLQCLIIINKIVYPLLLGYERKAFNSKCVV